jgi:phospholipid/cholesterol/gamma-HCH transport system substrate-binding protein
VLGGHRKEPTARNRRTTPNGYVPLGTNPWRGPRVPYGTPVEDPRNILPFNKFPFIPPQTDYDPGPPVVQLPPGVPPGPGPALNPPYPLPVAPADGPPPPPLPYVGPTVPSHGLSPDNPSPGRLLAEAPTTGAPANGVAFTTYDRNGTFTDPAGGTGVFAPGGAEFVPPENWVDLMLDPRPA